jgi:CRP-like cAMP-binding protein
MMSGSADIINEFGVCIDRMTWREGDTQFFGEVGLLENVPRTASVVAVDEVVTLSLSADQFHDLLQQCPAVQSKMTTIAKARMQNFLMRTVLA